MADVVFSLDIVMTIQRAFVRKVGMSELQTFMNPTRCGW